MNNLQISTNSLINLLLQQKSKNIFTVYKYYNINTIINQINESLKQLPILDNECEKIHIEDINKKQPSYVKKVFKEIKSNAKLYLSQYINKIIIHGSYADDSYIYGWSDLDVIIVLNKNTFNNSNLVNDLKYFHNLESSLYKLDPLQHHGIQYITEFDLLYYPDIYYPSNLLKDTKLLYTANDNYINIIKRNSHAEQLQYFYDIVKLFNSTYKSGIFKHHDKNGIYLTNNFKEKDDCMYQLKYYLSVVMLLPVLWLNLGRIYCSKKDSFKICKLYLSSKAWNIIDIASNVRKIWFGIPDNNIIPNYVKNIIPDNIFELGCILVNEMKSRLEKESFKYVKNYYDNIISFCNENNTDIFMCGTILNPGISDLDFITIDNKPFINNNVKAYLKPIMKNGGNVLVFPYEQFKYIDYFEKFSLIELKNISGRKYDFIKLTNEEQEFFKYIEIIEWTPERILLGNYLLTQNTEYEVLYIYYKSLYKCYKNMISLMNKKLEIIFLDKIINDDIEILIKECYKLYLDFEVFSDKYLSGNITYELKFNDYYYIANNIKYKFNILGLYLNILSQCDTKISGKLNNCFKSQKIEYSVNDKFKTFILKRWKILSKMYNWFEKKNIKRGLIKYTWLLNK